MQPPEPATDAESPPTYIVFRLAEELYGVELLTVREVIKMTAIKPVPYMVPYFRGVINLRGQIVSVIDLRAKFELPLPPGGQGMILVLEARDSLIGAIVDDLVAVEAIPAEDIDPRPAIETRIPADFFRGIAKKGDRLINLVDISACLSASEMRTIRSAKGSAA